MPTLAFHKVEPGFSWGVTNLSPQKFRRVLNLIRALNRTDISLTFDDGYSFFLRDAAPALLEAKLKAKIFVLTGYLGNLNSWDYSSKLKPSLHLSQKEIKELAQQGFEIQSHTHSHLDLSRVSDSRILDELKRSKSLLEELTEKRVTEICYPFGRYTKRVEEIAQEVGYTRGWSMNPSDNGPFTYGRWAVYGYDTPLTIRWKLQPGAFNRIEYLKVRITNTLSRAGRFVFWTESLDSKR